MNLFYTIIAANIFLTGAMASPEPGTITITGECSIEKSTGNQTYRFLDYHPHKLILGYEGIDAARYKISISNNGNTEFEDSQGSIQIGFARDTAPVRNPPQACPSFPENLKKECQEKNARENPPFLPFPSDRFTKIPNSDGSVEADIGPKIPGEMVDPDNFMEYKIIITRDKILDFTPVQIQTPTAHLGGVKAYCSIKAYRN